MVVVFLIEFIYGRANGNHAFPVFAAHAGLVPIIVFGLLTLISMGVNAILLDNPRIRQDGLASITEYNFLLFALNIVGAIALYIRTYQFITPDGFQQILLEYSQHQVRQAVDREMANRNGYRILTGLCRQWGIEISIGRQDHIPNLVGVPFSPLNRGKYIVTDVNLALLESASQRVHTLLPSNLLSPIWIAIPFRSVISDVMPEVAYVASSANSPTITNLFLRAVRVAPVDAAIMADDGLQLNRDLIGDAIRGGRVEEVEELLGQYLAILRSFLSGLTAYGVVYSSEEANKEDGFFSDWPILKKLERLYYSLIEQAFRSDDIEVIRRFLDFLYSVLYLSCESNDHLIFERFAAVIPSCYVVAKRVVKDMEVRKYVSSRCGSLLVNLCRGSIRLSLEDPAITAPKAQALGDYTEFSMVVFSRLLKLTLDAADYDQFKRYAAQAREASMWFGYSPSHESTMLKFQLEGVQDLVTRQSLAQKIAKEDLRAEQLARLKRVRRLSFIGLGGWLVHLFEEGKLDLKQYMIFASEIGKELTDPRELNLLYSEIVIDKTVSDLFGWSYWDNNEDSFIGRTTRRDSDWIGSYYVLRMLSLLSMSTANPQLDLIKISAQILEAVVRNLDSLRGSDIWPTILIDPDPVGFEHDAAIVKEAHEEAARKRESIEQDKVIQGSLDQDLISEFVKRVEHRWQELAIIRNLVQHLGRYEKRQDTHQPYGQLIRNDLKWKGIFVKGIAAASSGFDENLSSEFAKEEDLFLSKEFEILPTVELALNEITNAIEETISKAVSAGLAPVILYHGTEIEEVLTKSPKFVWPWLARSETPDFVSTKGQYGESLVIELNCLQLNSIVIVDIRRFGVLVQYPASKEGHFPLAITVQEISNAEAADLLKKQPDLINDPGTGAALDIDTAIRDLQQRVIVNAVEVCRFEHKDPLAGSRIVLAQDRERNTTSPQINPKRPTSSRQVDSQKNLPKPRVKSPNKRLTPKSIKANVKRSK